jgi:cell division protein FtsZ
VLAHSRNETDGRPQNYLAVIKVVIGGGGVNAVNRMIEAGPGRRVHRRQHGCPDLLMSDAEVKLDIGRDDARPRRGF